MIAFECSHCGKGLSAKEEWAGKKVKCPRCKESLTVPAKALSVVSGKKAKEQRPGKSSPEEATLPPRDLASEVKARGTESSSEDTFAGANRTGQPDVPTTTYPPELTSFLAPPQSPDEIGRLGAYRILKILGAGGMGVVYQAEDPQLQRHVALKAMLPTLAASEAARTRFLNEARHAAAIEHDHIVHIYQVGEDRGVPYLAMQFLRGESLEDRLRREPLLPLPEVLRIGREMAEGLGAAHEQGLIHRDIKPGNIWLEGSRARVKILDFGLARATSSDQHLTQSGSILGTPAYMAPEQAQGQTIDGRADLFSLGVVLYRLTTGELPFRGQDVLSTLMELATHEPPPPRKRNPAIPGDLSQLVMKLLVKDPARRIASAQKVVQAIQAIERQPLAGGDRTAVEILADADRKSNRTQTLAGPTVRPRLAPASAGSGRRRLYLLAGGGVLAVGLVLFLFAILFRSGAAEGTLVVEVDDPTAEVAIKRNDVIVQDKTKSREFRINPGDGVVEIFDKDGWGPLKTEPFTVTGSGRATVKVNMAEARLSRPRLTLDPGGPTEALTRVVFTPDSKLLIASGAGVLRVWGAVKWQTRRVIRPPGRATGPFALSADGQKLAVVSTYGAGEQISRVIYLMSLADGHVERTLMGHTGGIRAVAFTADGSRLVSGGEDKTIRLWNLATGATEAVIETVSPINGLALSPDGSRVAHDFLDSDACDIRELPTGNIVVRLKGGKVPGWWRGDTVAWSPDGKTLATGGEDGLRIWAPDGTRRWHLLAKVPITSVTFSVDSSRLLTTGKPPSAHATLFDLKTDKEPAVTYLKVPNPTIGDAYAGALSPDGKLAATVGSWGGIHEALIWKLATGTVFKRLGARSWLSGANLEAGWSPDGKAVAWRKVEHPEKSKASQTAFHLSELRFRPPLTKFHGAVLQQGPLALKTSDGNIVTVLNNNKPLCDLRLPGNYRLNGAFTLVGKDRAALISTGHSFGLFDTSTGKMLRSLWHAGAVWSLAPSPDGRYLMSIGQDQLLKIWDAEGSNLLLLTLYTLGPEWVLWTPEGYYACSAGGERLMGWTIQNGIDKDVTYYPGDHFHQQMYRPDVIRKVLEKGSVEEALTAANAARKE